MLVPKSTDQVRLCSNTGAKDHIKTVNSQPIYVVQTESDDRFFFNNLIVSIIGSMARLISNVVSGISTSHEIVSEIPVERCWVGMKMQVYGTRRV